MKSNVRNKQFRTIEAIRAKPVINYGVEPSKFENLFLNNWKNYADYDLCNDANNEHFSNIYYNITDCEFQNSKINSFKLPFCA